MGYNINKCPATSHPTTVPARTKVSTDTTHAHGSDGYKALAAHFRSLLAQLGGDQPGDLQGCIEPVRPADPARGTAIWAITKPMESSQGPRLPGLLQPDGTPSRRCCPATGKSCRRSPKHAVNMLLKVLLDEATHDRVRVSSRLGIANQPKVSPLCTRVFCLTTAGFGQRGST